MSLCVYICEIAFHKLVCSQLGECFMSGQNQSADWFFARDHFCDSLHHLHRANWPSVMLTDQLIYIRPVKWRRANAINSIQFHTIPFNSTREHTTISSFIYIITCNFNVILKQTGIRVRTFFWWVHYEVMNQLAWQKPSVAVLLTVTSYDTQKTQH